jgi:hypothetical protein
MVCFAVVPVKGCLPDSKRRLDRHGTIGVDCCSCDVLIDMVHSRDHSGDAGCAAREEECRVLKDLDEQFCQLNGKR